MALFGNKEEKAAEEAGTQAEAERLAALPATELAEALMPAFGPEGARPGHEVNILQVMNWLMKDYPGGSKHLKQLMEPTREAVQALENSGLVITVGGPHGPGARLKATALGEQAIVEGSAAKYLRG